MSGIESLVKRGMQMGVQTFAEGGLTGIRYIENPDGSRGIWTGEGYDYSIPQTVAADSIKKMYRSGPYASMLFDTLEEAERYRYSNDDAGTDYGAPRVEYSLGQGPWSSWDARNYFSDFDEEGNLRSLMMKNEDKYAANVPYIRDANGNFVPDWAQMTRVEHNTNTKPMDYAPLAILAPLAAAGISTALGAGAVSTGAGLGAAEGLGGAAFLPESLGAITGAEGFAPLYGGLGAGEAAAGIAGLGAAGEVVMPPITITGAAPAIPGLTAGEIAAGVGAAGAAANAIPSGGEYAPGENPEPYTNAPTPWWKGGIGSIAEKLGDWALSNPEKALTIAGTIGSIIEGRNADDSAAGGGGTPGWNGPISALSAQQTYTPAPEGYRPGFSPEHVYSRTSWVPGAANTPQQVTQSAPAALPTGPPPDVPPLRSERPYMPGNDQQFTIQIGQPQGPTEKQGILNGRVEIDPDYGFPEFMRPALSNMPARLEPTGFAAGGLTQGPGDGMSDHIPATIEGQQPAALSTSEFVVPADVVSHLGNGSTEAGAKVLYDMMDRIRQARTGSKQQARQINPAKFLP